MIPSSYVLTRIIPEIADSYHKESMVIPFPSIVYEIIVMWKDVLFVDDDL